jgi:phenylacetate-CoA ligase
MNKVLDTAIGACFSAMGGVALSSWDTYSLLFLPPLMGGFRDWASRKRAAAVFFNARRTVPAYRAFLHENGVETPSAFQDIPPMEKTNYIKRFRLEETCRGGRLPTRGAVIDESSGSSGTASNWVRGPQERLAVRQLIQYSVQATFGAETFVFLNAFALGPWATGMSVSMSLVDRCVIKSVGPDAKKILATLELLGPRYRYVIAGYPPFLKVLSESTTIDWQEYDVCAIAGGEGMSEALRAALNRSFKKTLSSYGASDLEINMAVETDFTIALRQAIATDEALAVDLCGAHESVPMIFQYDPLNYLIESDTERNLLFTLNRLENVSPRIRYNIRDRGFVRPMREVLEILAGRGVHLEHSGRRVDLPLLFNWGRQEQAVTFYGCKVTPEDVQNVVLRIPYLAENTAEFALHAFEDSNANKQLEFWVELKPGVGQPGGPATLGEDFLRELALVNQDFRESIRMVLSERRPKVKLFVNGESPIPTQDPRIKKRYIL